MKNNEGGEQAYQHTIEDAIADEDSRYQRFLRGLIKREVEVDENL